MSTNTASVDGLLAFHASFNNIPVYDEYEIRIQIDEHYPSRPPKVFETGSRIQPTFHKFTDGSLCLAAPLQVRLSFAAQPTLIGLVDTLVIPFLYSHTYFIRHGNMPFGELSHHGKGLVEFYAEFLGITDPKRILVMLALVYSNSSWRHVQCPCGSGRQLRSCHLSVFKLLKKHSTKNDIEYDATQIVKQRNALGIRKPSIPKVFAKFL